MRQLVERKQDVEIAGQKCCNAVIQTDRVFPLDRQLDLMQVRRLIASQQGIVLGENGLPQLEGIRLAGALLQSGEPSRAIKQRSRVEHVVPKTSRIADRRLVVYQNPVKLFFHPAPV